MRLIFLGIVSFMAMILPFSDVILGGDALLFRDHSIFFYPAKLLWLNSVLESGRIPLWNYAWGGGLPYYADISLGALWPLNLVLLLGGKEQFVKTYGWFIASHFALLQISAYYFFTKLGAKLYWSILFSLLLAWSGPALGFHSNIQMVGAMSGLCLAGGAWIDNLNAPKPFKLFLASLGLALPVYSGEPQFAYIGGILLLIQAASLKNQKLFISGVLTVFLSLLAAAPILLPASIFALNSWRGIRGSNLENQLSWSLQPIRLLEFVVPPSFPSNRDIADGPGGANLPFALSLYLGVFCFIGVVGSLIQSLKQTREEKFLGIGILFFILLTMGDQSPIPFYSWMSKIFPLWSTFRYPERLSCFLAIAMGLASFRFWDKFISSNFTWSSLFLIASSSTIAIVSIYLFDGSYAASCLHSGSFIVLLLLALAAYKKKLVQKNTALALIAAIAAIDLGVAGKGIILSSPASIASPMNYEILKELQDQFEADRGFHEQGGARRYITQELIANLPDYNRAANLDPMSRLAFVAWENLHPNVDTYFGLDGAYDYHTLFPREKKKLFLALAGKRAELERYMGVRYLGVREGNAGRLKLSINKDALPYVYLARPDNLENPAVEENNSLRILSKNDHSLRVEVSPNNSGRDLALVWNENFYPSWKAYLLVAETLKPLPIQATHWYAQAVLFNQEKNSQQKYIIEFRFEDQWILLGKILAILWGLLAIKFSVWRRT